MKITQIILAGLVLVVGPALAQNTSTDPAVMEVEVTETKKFKSSSCPEASFAYEHWFDYQEAHGENHFSPEHWYQVDQAICEGDDDLITWTVLKGYGGGDSQYIDDLLTDSRGQAFGYIVDIDNVRYVVVTGCSEVCGAGTMKVWHLHKEVVKKTSKKKVAPQQVTKTAAESVAVEETDGKSITVGTDGEKRVVRCTRITEDHEWDVVFPHKKDAWKFLVCNPGAECSWCATKWLATGGIMGGDYYARKVRAVVAQRRVALENIEYWPVDQEEVAVMCKKTQGGVGDNHRYWHRHPNGEIHRGVEPE